MPATVTTETRQLCPACRATNTSLAAECWLCHGKLAATEEIIVAEIVPPTKPLSEVFFQILLAAIVVLILLIGTGIGLDRQNRGMLIPYAVLVGPALLATGVRYGMNYSSGSQQSAANTFLTFVVSFALTLTVITGIAVAAFIGFFFYCLSAIFTGKF